jgi:hypothetical protein
MRRSVFAAFLLLVASSVYADPATGSIDFPDQVFRAWLDRTDLGRMIKRDASILRIEKAADGTEMLVMGEGFRDVLVATTNDAGKTTTICIGTVEGARAIFAVAKPPRAQP